MFRSISTFIKDPLPTDRYEEVEPGLNILDGVARIEEPLRSPVRGENCVAFFYRSFFLMTEGRAPATHKIKETEAYAPFELEMDGGTISVQPPNSKPFGHQDHQALQQQYGKEFQGVEDTIRPGDRVRLRGKIKKSDGKFVMKMKSITVIEKQAVASGVVGDRKKRRKKKK